MTELRQELFCLGEFNPDFSDVWFIEGSVPQGEDQETSNIYVLDEGRVVIDTGNISELAWFIDEHFPVGKIEKVIITHPHFDHTTGLSIILTVANPRVYMHPDSIGYTYMGALSFAKMTKEAGREDQIIAVTDGDVIEAGPRTLEVIHTPGHMLGGICLYDRESQSLFSQDLIFPSTYEANYLSAPDEKLGDMEELIASLEKLLGYPVKNLFPGHFLPTFGDGGEHVKNAYMQTVKHFVEDSTRRDEEGWVRLAAALANYGRLEEAVEYFDIALNMNPLNAAALLSKGLALTELGQYEEALEIFQKVLAAEPDKEEASIGMGFCLLGLGRTEEAMTIEAFKAKLESI
jgi:glyoxylase-like metal-dependent hydrolase (beta-lactamase superfamily II)